ncbi:hypothetical protein BV25DRAFT_1903191 [Artomyces pyxidatus]|uniref:Uncharacterized protein n=1 Tax=Artomyces pyxidatus TaxID=48021 RepID=A0ACB8SJ02_9AGAM|nr:hypothetical protein BV25DRAFT_1903191 [Artomyces pyxidatus]
MMSNASSLLLLPVELTIKVFLKLDSQSLLSVQLTCCRLHDIITQSLHLQYAVELAAAGLCDNPGDQMPVAVRLDALKRYERGWNDLSQLLPPLSPTTLLPQPGNSDTHILSGNVLACIDAGEEPNTVSALLIPSNLRGIAHRRWSLTFQFTAHDLIFDALQDLLILVSFDQLNPTLHIRLLSTGDPHPSTTQPAIPILNGNPIRGTGRVCGDHLALFVVPNTFESRNIRVLNWKTGDVVTQWLCPRSDMTSNFTSFSFLDDRHIMVLSTRGLDPPRLQLYSFLEPGRCCDFVFAEVIGLPRVVLRFCENTAPHRPGGVHQLGPFFTDPSERLVVIFLAIFGYDSIYVCASSLTLLSFARDKTSFVPWKSGWGFRPDMYPQGCTMVYGMKVVRCSYAGILSVYDYHPYRVARALRRQRNHGDSKYDDCQVSLPSYVTEAELPVVLRGLGTVYHITEDSIVVEMKDNLTSRLLLLTF